MQDPLVRLLLHAPCEGVPCLDRQLGIGRLLGRACAAHVILGRQGLYLHRQSHALSYVLLVKAFGKIAGSDRCQPRSVLCRQQRSL